MNHHFSVSNKNPLLWPSRSFAQEKSKVNELGLNDETIRATKQRRKTIKIDNDDDNKMTLFKQKDMYNY